MNIDKAKLKIGFWWEDENHNVLRKPNDNYSVEAPKGAVTYHTCFPLEVTERIYTVHTPEQKATCKHKRKYWKPMTGLRKEFKGHTCMNCGCTQTRKWWQPWGRKWDEGTTLTHIISFNTTYGSGQDVILAMVNSGDYTLEEAISVYSSACERCMNVLAYKYTNGADGYAEHSKEWEKCNTECSFCKNE